jgi:hypothetical protein
MLCLTHKTPDRLPAAVDNCPPSGPGRSPVKTRGKLIRQAEPLLYKLRAGLLRRRVNDNGAVLRRRLRHGHRTFQQPLTENL